MRGGPGSAPMDARTPPGSSRPGSFSSGIGGTGGMGGGMGSGTGGGTGSGLMPSSPGSAAGSSYTEPLRVHRSADDEVVFLRAELERERKRREAAERAIGDLREESARTAMQLEEEEENITNKLMKRLAELKREKERMARQSESEEEFLTNTLQIRLEELQRQKHNIIASAEAEQEFIVNKLQRQLDELKVEKSALERKVQRLSRSNTPGAGTPASSPAMSMRSSDGASLSRGHSLTGSLHLPSGGTGASGVGPASAPSPSAAANPNPGGGGTSSGATPSAGPPL